MARKRYPKKDLWKETPKSEEKQEEEKPQHVVLEIQDVTIPFNALFTNEPKKEGE